MPVLDLGVVRPVFRGVFDVALGYDVLSMVNHEGLLYIAKVTIVANSGQIPGASSLSWESFGGVTVDALAFKAPLYRPTFTNFITIGDNGAEGGQINLKKGTLDNLIAGNNVVIDVAFNSIRIFEEGGNYRGISIPITNMKNAIGSVVATLDDVNARAPLYRPTFTNFITIGDNDTEGGQINFKKGTLDNLIAGNNVVIDLAYNNIRIFEEGGNYRGISIPITNMKNAIGSVVATLDDVNAKRSVVWSGSSQDTLNAPFLVDEQTYLLEFYIYHDIVNRLFTLPFKYSSIYEGRTTSVDFAGDTFSFYISTDKVITRNSTGTRQVYIKSISKL